MPSDFLDDIVGTDTSSPTDARLAEEQEDSLYEALECLTERQLFVISRHYGLYDGERFSLREIAELMGCRWEAVRKHHNRALRKLGTQLPLWDRR